MSETVLSVLKFCLLAVLYLFLARVVWVVGTELRGSPAPAPVAPVARTETAPAGGRRKRGWRLEIVEPKTSRGAGFDVDGEVTIGRATGCRIALPADTFVSQVHARVYERDGDVYVEDLGSTNGTYVNGERLAEPRRLRKGDRVQTGETVLEATR